MKAPSSQALLWIGAGVTVGALVAAYFTWNRNLALVIGLAGVFVTVTQFYRADRETEQKLSKRFYQAQRSNVRYYDEDLWRKEQGLEPLDSRPAWFSRLARVFRRR